MPPPPPQERWTNLSCGLLTILAGGTVYSYGAYSNGLKENLGLSQAQLEYAALSANVGNYIGVAGFFYDRFGAVASVRFGCLLIGFGYGAQWLLMARGGGVFGPGDATGLLCVCCFIWGHGSGYLDCAAIGTGVASFPRRRGAVVGLLKSLYGLASSMVVLLCAYWTSSTGFVAALALLAFALPAGASLKMKDAAPAPDDSDADDAAAGGALDRGALRVVGLAGLALAVAVARIVAPTMFDSTAADVIVALAVVAGVAWVVGGAAVAPKVAIGAAEHNPLHVAADDLHVDDDDDDDADEQDAAAAIASPAKAKRAGDVDSHPSKTLRTPELWLFFLAILPGAGAGLMTINNLGQIVSARGGAKATQEAATTHRGGVEILRLGETCVLMRRWTAGVLNKRTFCEPAGRDSPSEYPRGTPRRGRDPPPTTAPPATFCEPVDDGTASDVLGAG